MKYIKFLFLSFFSTLFSILFFLNCAFSPTSKPESIPSLIVKGMPDTTAIINDSFFVHFTPIKGGDFRYVVQLDNYGSPDTISDSLFKVAFTDSGTTTILIRTLLKNGLVSFPDTIAIHVIGVVPIVKIAVRDTNYSVLDTVSFSALSHDGDGTIKKYLWSFDGIHYDTTVEKEFHKAWSVDSFGLKTIYAKVIDNDGIVSEVDSVKIEVHHHGPTVTADTDFGCKTYPTISRADSLRVPIFAIDTNGRIKKIFWDVGADGWDDSAAYPDTTRYVKYSSGGYVTIVVGAKNENGLMGTDTFHVLFNRPPASCGLNTNFNADKGGWNDFNYSTGKGNIQVSFSGEDPDLPYDTVRFDLYWGADQENLSKTYSSVTAPVSITDIPTQTRFFWKIVAKDLYGDSVLQTGSYISNNVPGAGIFWDLVTNSPNYVPTSDGFDDGSLMTSCSFDDKLWLFFNTPDGNPKAVYNSTDGVSWNLVTNSPNYPTTSGSYHAGSLMTACSFDNKIWLFFNTPFGSPKAVYNSTDGVLWNLVTDSPNYSNTSGIYYDGSLMTACSFDNKMWLFFNNPGGYPKTVYTSTDGVSWNLVTNSPNYATTSGRSSDGSLMTACSFDNKMWLFFNTPDGNPKGVFTSTDGASWNLLTDSPNYAATSGSYPDGSVMTACSFGGKIWLFFNTPNGDPKSVYISGKTNQ